jgi:hypothetical protein
MIVWILGCVLVFHFLWWIVAALVLAAVVHIVRAMAVAAAEQRELARQAGAVLAARADAENTQVLAGDDSGVYGDYPPAVK